MLLPQSAQLSYFFTPYGGTSCSESILMTVSDIIIYIMKIMWRDFNKIRSIRFRDIQKSAKSPNFEWSCT